MHLLLGVHHPLVWNGVLQHDWGWLLHILLWGLLRGRQCWGTWSISRFFHPFKVNDLREMVSIMAILTTKGTREVCPKIVVILPLVCYYFPLGGSGSPDSGCPRQVGSVGGDSLLVLDYYCFSFFLSFWHYSTDGLDFPYSVVQNFDIVEWERAEQN
jgi:hypothetical protein